MNHNSPSQNGIPSRITFVQEVLDEWEKENPHPVPEEEIIVREFPPEPTVHIQGNSLITLQYLNAQHARFILSGHDGINKVALTLEELQQINDMLQSFAEEWILYLMWAQSYKSQSDEQIKAIQHWNTQRENAIYHARQAWQNLHDSANGGSE